jgi:hypothetical protein
MNKPEHLCVQLELLKSLYSNQTTSCHKEGKKKVKKKGVWTTESTALFELEGWHIVLETAEMKQDEKLWRRIRGFDLFACEARYHPICHMRYVSIATKQLCSSDEEAKCDQSELENSHRAAFAKVCEVTDREVIQNFKKS